MEVLVLLKQVPSVEAIDLDEDLRLPRERLAAEVDAYARRALGWAIQAGARVTVLTMGPPSADETLAWALACGAEAAVLVTDPALRGSDVLVTAKVLARAIRQLGHFDLITLGRFSVDGSTGQLGPTLAELLAQPFIHAAVHLEVSDQELLATSELDDGTRRVRACLPAVVAVAERLVAPPHPDPGAVAAVDRRRIQRVSVSDLGLGFSVGAEGSPTRVLGVDRPGHHRAGRAFTGSPERQLAALAAWLRDYEFVERTSPSRRTFPSVRGAVLADPTQPGASHAAFALLSQAIDRTRSHVIALGYSNGLAADEFVALTGGRSEAQVASALNAWLRRSEGIEVLVAPATDWSREVLARLAGRLDIGLIGDATDLCYEGTTLKATKPVGASELLATVTATAPPALVTLRATVGTTPVELKRATARTELVIDDDDRLTVLEETVDLDLAALERAPVLIGVGLGVAEADLPWVRGLADRLGAEVVASRKVADRGWLPRARQLGATGKRLAPQLYLAVGIRGTTNHLVGVSGAGLVIAINTDPASEIVSGADATLVADYRQVLAPLVDLFAAGSPTSGSARAATEPLAQVRPNPVEPQPPI